MTSVKMKTILMIISLSALLILILMYMSGKLTSTFYIYESARVPKGFDGFKIVHLSDIHCKSFGNNNKELIDTINNMNPDIIFITGDSIDKYHSDLSPLEFLFEGIQNTAPIFAVSGNHECDDPALYSQLLELYDKYGITDLDDTEIIWSFNGASIQIKGLGAFQNKINWDNDFMTDKHPELFSIILNHYPQLNRLAYYDLILSGHIHGGVIRIPFIGGILGNDGEFFPEYDGGRYNLLNSTMYVSKGIGDTVIPRVNNRPEVVCITLKHKE